MKRISLVIALGIVILSPQSAANTTRRRLFASLFVGLILCLQTTASLAQNQRISNRSLVQLPSASAMGDAQVALPVQQSAFFYNPAHAAHSPFHLTIIGVRASTSTNVPNQLRYFQDELNPAINDGIENLANNELKALYDETLRIGSSHSFLHADLLAPSVGFKAGPLGVGIGIFGSSFVHYTFPDAGGGLPIVNVQAVADGMAVASAGIDLSRFGIKGLSTGITTKYTNRFVSFKNKTLDAISPNEPFYILNGTRMNIDLGFQYKLPVLPYFPGTFYLGLALYDIVGSSYKFSHHSTVQGTELDTEINQQVEIANGLYEVHPSFRLGLAYSLPDIPVGLIDGTGITLDYMGYSNPAIDQAFFAKIRMGIQARIKVVSLRTGINQGYPTVGAGLSLGFVDLDYAFFGREEGRFPGQLPSWHHTAQIRFGI